MYKAVKKLNFFFLSHGVFFYPIFPLWKSRIKFILSFLFCKDEKQPSSLIKNKKFIYFSGTWGCKVYGGVKKVKRISMTEIFIFINDKEINLISIWAMNKMGYLFNFILLKISYFKSRRIFS